MNARKAERRLGGPTYWAAFGGGIAGALLYARWLQGEDLSSFYSTAAQVLVGLIIAFVLERRSATKTGQDVEPLSVHGLDTMVAGLGCATGGMLITDPESPVNAVLLCLSVAGVLSGLVALFLLVTPEGDR